MLLATDSYFHIGLSHLNSGRPCQDYALSRVYKDAAFAIVSDGCSSGGETDVGARILALSTALAMRDHWTTVRNIEVDTAPLEIDVRQRVMMAGSRETLGLSNLDMLATCVYAYITPHGGFIHLKGDGVLAYKKRNGNVCMSRYEWADNKPFYPAYIDDHFAGFIMEHGGDINAKRLTAEHWEYSHDGKFSELPSEEFTLGEGIRGITRPFSVEELTYLDCIAVFSDGVTQIEGLDWKDAVVELLAFKTTEGVFAKRRMMRVIKDAQKNGKSPIDDISYAVVRLITPEESDSI